MSSYVTALVALVVIFLLGPRAKLLARRPDVEVPDDLSLPELADWLAEKERQVPDIVEGTEAGIQFASPESPEKTSLCFLYIHGFSASWPETHPVTARLATRYDANVLQARLAGHGSGPDAMIAPAEHWLESVAECWEIATRLGDRVVIVATSTGAPLSVWLASLPGVSERLEALLFMSPNFRIRTRFDFLLTAPWSNRWLHLILGRHREWKPSNDGEAKFWTWRYSTLALIEMQKVVNWVRGRDLKKFTTPLAVMYMVNDPTIDPAAAIHAFTQWGAERKALIPVIVEGEAAEHVFVGDIAGPHRTDWCVGQFAGFLDSLSNPSDN